jgi:hypothetical protein
VEITHRVVVVDAIDLDSESRFWAGVLGGTVDAEDAWHVVLVDGEPRVGVQLAPDHVRPEWPDGAAAAGPSRPVGR